MRKDMLPAGPLMKEHRLIERMVRLIEENVADFERTKRADTGFIKDAVEFMSVYADECHHGKEERILFKRLDEKRLSDMHRKIMDRLIEEHRIARVSLDELKLANQRFEAGDQAAFDVILGRMKALTELYPAHIKLEDEGFFLPCMEYFSDSEKKKMLDDFFDFDNSLIHSRYRAAIERLESKHPEGG